MPYKSTILPVAGLFLAVFATDGLAWMFWEDAAVLLGGMLGLELGLLIFVNCLLGLLIVDLLEPLFQLPGFGWFYNLTPGAASPPRPPHPPSDVTLSAAHAAPPTPPAPAQESDRRRLRKRAASGPVADLLRLTAVFYLLETLLLPFLPIHSGLQCEAILASGVILWMGIRRRVTG